MRVKLNFMEFCTEDHSKVVDCHHFSKISLDDYIKQLQDAIDIGANQLVCSKLLGSQDIEVLHWACSSRDEYTLKPGEYWRDLSNAAKS